MLERGDVEGVKRWVNEWLTPPPGPSGKESLERLVSAAACLPLSALLEDSINNLAKIASGAEVSKQQVVLLLVGRQIYIYVYIYIYIYIYIFIYIYV